ncbi:Uncharacterized protein Rs2_21550 [Raphanus sativus]|nr:Uncharacterized protein Rs2_21550 [Raphanus sativus]
MDGRKVGAVSEETDLTSEIFFTSTAVCSASSICTASAFRLVSSPNRLISCNLHSTNGSVSLQAWGIKFMSPRSFLLTVEAFSGRWISWKKRLTWQHKILPCVELMKLSLKDGGDGLVMLGHRCAM